MSGMDHPILSLAIPGDPVPKGRPKLTTRGGHARAYTPTKTRSYEALVSERARSVMDGAAPHEGPLAVRYSAVLAVPKSWTKRDRALALSGALFPTGPRHDVDNLSKAALDALNTIVWRDDGQVVRLTATKRYGEEPGAFVEVWAA